MANRKPWHEQDAFWEIMGPVLFTERRWEHAPQEVEAIVSLLQLPEGARVLDLCCGLGRHTVEFARRGFQVTGVDRTAAYVESARRGAKEEGLDVEFVEEDMRTFCRTEAFDAAVNIFTSFGYFEKPEDDRQVATNVCRSLKTGGVFVVDIMGKEVLARVFQERRWEERNGCFFLQETKVKKNWSWVESRWILLGDGERREFTISHRIYSAVELSALLRDCGFGKVEVYGDIKGRPYDHTAERLVVVAHKEDST